MNILAASIAALVLFAAPGASGAQRGFADGAPSEEALIARFLDALREKDPGALHRLRVTEGEYVEIILPGSVPKGQPLRTWPTDVSEYFWTEFDTKARYVEQALLASYGGRRFEVKERRYERGDQEYATYRARKQLRLILIDQATGEELELATGSVAERNGRYKFVSYKRD